MDNGGTTPGTGVAPGSAGTFQLQVYLSGMDAEDSLQVALPYPDTGISLSDLLSQVFPEDEDQQREMIGMLDTHANPDLPEIYEAISVAIDEWRSGLCELLFSGDDAQTLDPSDPIKNHLHPNISSEETKPASPPFCKGGLGGFPPSLHLHLQRQYKAVDYAVQQGFWDTKTELLEWLETHTLLYFIDKHEFSLRVTPDGGEEEGLLSIAKVLQADGLISPSQETGTLAITQDGRRLIGRLLAETESYIDLYDHLKDTAFVEEADTVEFDTGNGADLRVPVFIAEGLDPIRTVFLLRLYDGTLDIFSSTWRERIKDENFFDEILEPVVNRQNVDEALLDRIIGAGYVYLEERHQAARESAEREEIIQRVRAET